MPTNEQDLAKFLKAFSDDLLLARGGLVEGRKYDSFTFDEVVRIFYFINLVENHIGNKTPDISDSGGKVICYWKWRVGITHNLEERKKFYQNKPEFNEMALWNDWDCDSDQISRNVERFFKRGKKTKGDEGGGKNPHFLYCFYLGKDTKP